MNGFMAVVNDFKIVDGVIVLLGIMGVAVVAERFKALYFDLSLSADFYHKVMELMGQKQLDKAVAVCSTQEKKPLAIVLKRLLENSHLNPEELEKIFQVSTSEVIPPLTRRMGYLAMIGNVVTMVGLLGTVIGLIMSFQAVGIADPSQKQTLLAQGISVAMHATALGLLVAIPVMIAYSFLTEKQNSLLAQVDHLGQEMLEYLRSQDRAAWTTDTLFPATQVAVTKAGKAPPPPASRAS